MPKPTKFSSIGHFIQRRSTAGYVLSQGVFWKRPTPEEFEKNPFYNSENIVAVVKANEPDGRKATFADFDAYSAEYLIADFIKVTDSESALKFCSSYGLPCHYDGTFVDETTQPISYFAGNELSKIVFEARLLRMCQIIVNATSYDDEVKGDEYFGKKFKIEMAPLNNVENVFTLTEIKTGEKTKFRAMKNFGFSDSKALDGAIQFLRKTVMDKMRESGAAITLQPRQRGEGSRVRLQAFVVPDDLLGVMWHRFTDGAGTRETIVECEICGQWFRALRTDARMCSDKCRQRNHRGGTSTPRRKRPATTP